MKICAAQAKPVKGNIADNIHNHKRLIELGAANGAQIIIFPELSITGYEPALAKELATDKDDNRFNDFQDISNTNQIIIGIGMPVKNNAGVCIGMIIFQPHKDRQLYTKKYLHADEEEFFVSGQNFTSISTGNNKIAFAICYELSVPEHSDNAFKRGATIYITSVAKTAIGTEKAIKNLSGIAGKYSMTVVMSNSVGYSDNFESGGKTSAWNNKGILIAQLNDTNEGIIIIDTDTDEISEYYIDRNM